MLFNEALSYLLSLGHETLTIKLGLANTERLLAALENPHKSFPSVQIAGTNGKGSTAVMLESICRAAGIHVGLFTSPHLISITERIRINGEDISEKEFARLTERVKQTAEELLRRGELQTLPTFFEHVTAIALLAFHDAKVELAILETGLGGRLDSTTAAGAQIVALTPIAMDHEEYLGKTLAEIAAEKAAVIRPGVSAIVAPQPEEALAVIRQRSESVGVRPRLVESVLPAVPTTQDSEPGRVCATFETRNDRYECVCLGLRGRHQVINAATAIMLAEALCDRGFDISRHAILSGLKNARHPGRLELWDGNPPILFDGAHNPASARALRDYLDEFVHQPVTMIFGAMRDKALNELAAILFPSAHDVILTELDNPRAATVEALAAAVPSSFDRASLHEARSVTDALQIAREINAADSLILITGSLYLVGEVQQSIRESFGGSLPAVGQ
ncbi:MAG TPA: folylpolyglutamate synthase/dihydrofolate synthase family protein [Pyrinomonadaceae bacterium]|nr:folylpolyglutamate synthase/dihydrofolate synthase family protein [Pyrinomonadaceae bacterium]